MPTLPDLPAYSRPPPAQPKTQEQINAEITIVLHNLKRAKIKSEAEQHRAFTDNFTRRQSMMIEDRRQELGPSYWYRLQQSARELSRDYAEVFVDLKRIFNPADTESIRWKMSEQSRSLSQR